MTEDEMVGWLHQLDGHEFEEAPEVGDGQGSLACCSPCGLKESDMTERLNCLTDAPKSPQIVTAGVKLKDTCSLEENI